QPPIPNSPAAKLFKAKPGFANYYFNEQETKRLWDGFLKHGDFTSLRGPLTIVADAERNQKVGPCKFLVMETVDKNKKVTQTLAQLGVHVLKFDLDPLKENLAEVDLKEPTGSGGLVMALYQYWRLLTSGPKGFEHGFNHGGIEPFYPPPLDGSK